MSTPHPHPDLHHLRPERRLRRLRQSPGIRALVRETQLQVSDLIMPLFVKEDLTGPEPVESMPGVFRLSPAAIVEECRELAALGIPAIALFPFTDPSLKNQHGSEALNPENLIARTLRAIRVAGIDLVVIADVALDPYTSHGHDGILTSDGRDVDNDATLDVLCTMSVLLAQAGADFVAPSGMMDGQVRSMRAALDSSGHLKTGILAYSAKFASAYYGPFREAVGSKSAAGTSLLDKRTYQQDPANAREAILESLLDEEEGADILMVKPAGAYLDILTRLRERTELPLAAYQVSGEYAQIQAAAERGWLDLKRTRDESLLAIKRAGADMILTYFAKSIACDLRN
jgi:porphobilinogen synthase